jgi:hypothetical protein
MIHACRQIPLRRSDTSKRPHGIGRGNGSKNLLLDGAAMRKIGRERPQDGLQALVRRTRIEGPPGRAHGLNHPLIFNPF